MTVTFTPDSVGTYVITLTATAEDGVAVAKTFTITAPALVYTTGDGTPVAPFNAGIVCPKSDVLVNCNGTPVHIFEGNGAGLKLAVGFLPTETKAVPEGCGVTVHGF